MASNAELVVGIITALGLREVVVLVARAVIKHVSGRAPRERARVQDLVARVNAADDELDHQAKWRRQVQEHASEVRSIAMAQGGLKPSDFPPFPGEPERHHHS